MRRASSSSLREASATVAPSWAKSRAVAAPIPPLAPVMSATLPSNCFVIVRCPLLPRLSYWLSHTVRWSGYTLLSCTCRTRDKRARSNTQHQRDRHHDDGADERGFVGHQEDDAQQQGGHCLQRCRQNGVMDAPHKRLGQRAAWCLLCQPGDGAPARLDERCTRRDHQDQTDQRHVDPASPEAPCGNGHVEPCDEDEQQADAGKWP